MSVVDKINALLEAKEFGGEEPDFETWDEERLEKYWKTMGGSFEKVLAKVKEAGFADDPEGFVSTLHKKVTGKWPTEKS